MDIVEKIAGELSATAVQLRAAISLLDDGSTVPFVARYRKEATGGLDDTQLRTLESRLSYLRELDKRRGVILSSISEQEKLTPELEAAIRTTDTKTRLEDLYLPYRPRRRTKGKVAREAGLEPLAAALLQELRHDPKRLAEDFLNPEKEITTAELALEGARAILIEDFSEDAELVGQLRERVAKDGVITSRVVGGKEDEGAKYSDYFDFSEPLKRIPSHRALALLRGRKDNVLKLSVVVPEPVSTAGEKSLNRCEQTIASHFGIADRRRPADSWRLDTVRRSWKLKLLPHLEADFMAQLRDRAETEAIRVFATNLHDLLLSAPAGHRPTIGLDPGLRTGVKIAVVDGTGKLIDHGTIRPRHST